MCYHALRCGLRLRVPPWSITTSAAFLQVSLNVVRLWSTSALQLLQGRCWGFQRLRPHCPDSPLQPLAVLSLLVALLTCRCNVFIERGRSTASRCPAPLEQHAASFWYVPRCFIFSCACGCIYRCARCRRGSGLVHRCLHDSSDFVDARVMRSTSFSSLTPSPVTFTPPAAVRRPSPRDSISCGVRGQRKSMTGGLCCARCT